MLQNYKRLAGALAVVIAPGVALAQTDATDPAQDTIQLAQAGGDPAATYAALLKEIEGLEVYNELLQRQLETQQSELQNIQNSIGLVPDLERQIPPLLIRMVQGLEEFVRLDIPFLTEERNERVAELQLLVERADVNDAEKIRRILEAWQIETEYGGSYSTYIGQLEIDGMAREVDFLQIGRVALLYQTTDDEAITGAWDPRSNSWVALGSEHRNSVRQALRMARNQIAPDLVLLPITPPSAE